MKKTTFALCIVLIATTAGAQWNVNGSNLTTTDNVGIGTTSALSPLHIQSSTNRIIRLDFSGISTGQSYTWQSWQTNSVEQWRVVGRDSDNANLEIWNKNSDNVLSLLQNGNVGIGTASPQAQLEIVSSAAYTAHEGNSFVIRTSNSPSPNDSRMLGMTITLDGSSNVSSSFQKSVGLFAQSAGNWSNDVDMLFYTRGSSQAPYFSEKMRIKSNGNVGIGTSSPTYHFHVVGSDRARFEQTQGIIDIVAYGSGTHAFNSTAGLFASNQNALVMTGLQGSGDIKFITRPSGYLERMIIKSNGNIGIGTSNPESKLAVHGQIRATEVKVLADINVPDYVFEPNYELRTLQETKEYITENKHLPEIPSAKEMEVNGIDLGDMNMRLLRKIEELTLYQIELLEKLEQQNERLQHVETELQTLRE